jgi:hypothetical protein
VDPVPDPLLLGKSGSAVNRTRTSGSVARNSDDQTTEAVDIFSSIPQFLKLSPFFRFPNRNVAADSSNRVPIGA